MNRSFPLTSFSVGGHQSSLPGRGGTRKSQTTGHTSPFSRHLVAGFTLIELLIVVAVIAILAGITLAAMGGANQKAARDRTKAEIAAIANALQAYHSQNGEYPPSAGGLVPYQQIQGYLATERIEVLGTTLKDPFGGDYFYSRPGTRNRVSFDLWSTAGSATNEPNKHIGNW